MQLPLPMPRMWCLYHYTVDALPVVTVMDYMGMQVLVVEKERERGREGGREGGERGRKDEMRRDET